VLDCPPAPGPLSEFAIARRNAYLRPISRKPIELPPEVARNFVGDVRAFHAAKDSLKKDEIAAKQLWLLKQHWTGKLRMVDVMEMFQQMRNQA